MSAYEYIFCGLIYAKIHMIFLPTLYSSVAYLFYINKSTGAHYNIKKASSHLSAFGVL